MHLWAGNSPTDRLVYQSRRQWIRVLEVDEEFEIDSREETAEEIEAVTETEYIEPVVTEPKVIEPAVTESKLIEHVVTESKLIEPIVTESKLIEPIITEPEVIESVVTESDVVEHVVTDPELIESFLSESDVTEPVATDPELIESFVSGSKVNEPVVTESDATEPVIPITGTVSTETEIKDLVSIETVVNFETELDETDHQEFINNQIQETIDSDETLTFIETIVNETLKELNQNQNECKISGQQLSSSTFDEDFCNFITCDPLSNC